MQNFKDVFIEIQNSLNLVANEQLLNYISSSTDTPVSIPVSVSSTPNTYVKGNTGKSFFENLISENEIGYYTPPGSEGICGYIAGGLILLYADYFYNDNYIDDSTYLNPSGNAFKGDSFTKKLYSIGINDIGYGDELTAAQAAWVMRTYLSQERNINMGYWSQILPTVGRLKEQIDANRPVLLCGQVDDVSSSGTNTVDHNIVVYGYTPYDLLITHYGWENYSDVVINYQVIRPFISDASAISSYS